MERRCRDPSFTKHDTRAHETGPAFDVPGRPLQAICESIDHRSDGGVALVGRHRVDCGDLLAARPVAMLAVTAFGHGDGWRRCGHLRAIVAGRLRLCLLVGLLEFGGIRVERNRSRVGAGGLLVVLGVEIRPAEHAPPFDVFRRGLETGRELFYHRGDVRQHFARSRRRCCRVRSDGTRVVREARERIAVLWGTRRTGRFGRITPIGCRRADAGNDEKHRGSRHPDPGRTAKTLLEPCMRRPQPSV